MNKNKGAQKFSLTLFPIGWNDFKRIPIGCLIGGNRSNDDWWFHHFQND